MDDAAVVAALVCCDLALLLKDQNGDPRETFAERTADRKADKAGTDDADIVVPLVRHIFSCVQPHCTCVLIVVYCRCSCREERIAWEQGQF
jgi:hypothetical protein